MDKDSRLFNLGAVGLWNVVAQVVASLALVIAEGAVAALIRDVIAILDGAPHDSTFARVAVLLILAGSARGLLTALASALPAAAEIKALQEIRRRYLDALLQASRDTVGISDNHHELFEIAPRAARGAANFLWSVSSAVVAIALAGVMVFLAPRLAMIALPGMMICGVASLAFTRVSRGLASRQIAPARDLTRGLTQASTNWVLLRLYGLEKATRDRLHALNQLTASLGLRSAVVASVGPSLTAVLGICLITALLAQQHAHATAEAAASFVGLVYIMMRIVQHLNALVGSVGAYHSCRPAMLQAAEARAVLRRTTAFVADEAAVSAGTSHASPPRIDVRDVSFRRDGVGEVLAGLTFDVREGEHFAVVGPSGSGKSTLLHLLGGLLSPTGGHVRIEGQEVRAYVAANRASLAYVGPGGGVIDGTIAENLGFGLVTVPSEVEQLEAMERAGAASLAAPRAGGIERRVDENGSGLSAGELQRLMLARALLRRPSLMLLDEITSNVDSATEDLIADQIKELKGRCTVVMVTHRSGILRHFDRVLDLSTGRVVGGDSASRKGA